jgi:hypothetical protein
MGARALGSTVGNKRQSAYDLRLEAALPEMASAVVFVVS